MSLSEITKLLQLRYFCWALLKTNVKSSTTFCFICAKFSSPGVVLKSVVGIVEGADDDNDDAAAAKGCLLVEHRHRLPRLSEAAAEKKEFLRKMFCAQKKSTDDSSIPAERAGRAGEAGRPSFVWNEEKRRIRGVAWMDGRWNNRERKIGISKNWGPSHLPSEKWNDLDLFRSEIFSCNMTLETNTLK